MKKSKLWQGLSGVLLFVFIVILSLTILANNYAMLVNDALGLSTSGLTLSGSDYGDENGELTDEGYWELIDDSYAFCIEEEEQGSVLLKNEGNALPLDADERDVTLFGNNSAHLIYRSGAGGPTPNDEYVIDMDKAFTDAGFNINQELFDAYASSGTQRNTNTAGEVPASFYTQALKDTFADYNDVAIVTFARYGTENTDLSRNTSDGKPLLQLSDNEEALLQMINESGQFDKIIVLLNGAMTMDLYWLDEYNVDACLWFGNPGYYGMPGVVNVLTGEANPSGHLVNTIAEDSMKSPAMQNFGDYTFTFDGQPVDRTYGTKYVVYKEGIYVGYKYYETRYEDAVLGQGNAGDYNYAEEVAYPFGYGLSYSTYDQQIDSVVYNASKDTFTVNVTVRNTNNMEGKASVQVYVQSPYTDYDKQNGVEKASVQLVDYEKVDVPANGTEHVSIEFDRYLLASYDSNGAEGYIFDAGDYYFAIGNGAHEALNNILAVKGGSAVSGKLVDHEGNSVQGETDCVEKWTAPNTDTDTTTYRMSQYNEDVEVTNQFEDADLNYWADEDQQITYLTRSDWTGTFPTTVTELHANERMVDGLRMDKYEKAADAPSYSSLDGIEYNVLLDEPIDFIDMKGVPLDDPKWDEFLSQMTLADLCISIGDARGIAGVASVNKPMNAISEGPEGLLAKFKFGDQRACTGWATLPTVTATWDHEMQARYGDLMAEEALFSGVAMVNAPGCNINRTPYGGRASEYMSEDSMLSYYSVSNILYAMREKGLIANVKHCFLNEQETNRQGVATFSNEQAIREIYLRPFEGALTVGESMGVMTSYNRIGLTYAATHETLMQDVMRGEWGYEGSIIDDALTESQYYSSTGDMLMAGTNIFCLDGNRSSQMRQLIESTDDGTLLRKLQESNKYIFNALLHSSIGGSIDDSYTYEDTLMWWQQLLIAINVIVGAAALASIAGYVVFTYVKRDKKMVKEEA